MERPLFSGKAKTRSLDERLVRLNHYRNEALLRRICGSYGWRCAAPIRSLCCRC
jgi:hypothetical protein